MTRAEQTRLLTLLGLLFTILVTWFPQFSSSSSKSEECYCLTVSFLDVGQGDAILIETPDGKEMLIDGGPDSSIMRELSDRRGLFDTEIDVMVATHPDLDHVGGLVDVLERYTVGTIIMIDNEGDSGAAKAFALTAPEEGAEVILADAGQVFSLGASTSIQIFAPTGDESKLESNTASIVLRVVYGDTSFMLTGDAPSEIENYLVKTYGTQLDSDVLKLGHHGSKTSTSDLFLDAVTPEFAVVSAGIDNRYGHPHQDVMGRVFKRNIETSHTGTDGTVVFQSDGKTVRRK